MTTEPPSSLAADDSVLVIGLDELPDDLPRCTDTVIVMDVIFAFTVAALAFARGARRIDCVASVEEARRFGSGMPGAFLLGEESGQRPRGFDAGNSPTEIQSHDLHARNLVQSTRFGTTGLLRCGAAKALYAASAVNLTSTAGHVGRTGAMRTLIVATGQTSEDVETARHLAEALEGRETSRESLRAAILASRQEHEESWTRARDAEERAQFRTDVEECAKVDSLDVVMLAARRGRRVTLTRA